MRVFMLRPWKVAVAVVLGAAMLPTSAMAQTQPPDTTGPDITIRTPAEGAKYTIGQPVAASFSCVDSSGIADCVAPVPLGANIDTATAGPHVFTVTSHDQAGNVSSARANYDVVESDPGDVGGTAPATLTLTLGTPTGFTPFVPGVDAFYTTTLAARILSSALDATLTVADASTTQTGHLINGDYALPQTLQAGAAKQGAPTPTATAPIGGSASPTTLLVYTGGPVNETATILFKQGIGATDALRTGPYSKTLTFTLSTTTP
jgi:hypothetical protein